MISFTIITSTPAALRDRLIERDVIKQVSYTGNDGQPKTALVGVRKGLEWIEVQNIMLTDLGPPPVRDTRHCYLVKLVRDAEANEREGFDPTIGNILNHTKLGAWVLANSVPETLTSADGRSWPSRRVGANFWAVVSDDFGVWQ